MVRLSEASRKRLKRLTIILGTAMIAALLSVGVATAASEGSSSSGLRAGSALAAACGAGITASYTTAYASSIPGYSRRVDLAGIPAGCLSESYTIQLTGTHGVAVGSEMTGTLPSSGATARIATGDAPDASLVTGISVVVSPS